MHVRAEALKSRKSLGIVVIEQQAKFPVAVVAGMHRPELHVKVANDVRITFDRLELSPAFIRFSDCVDHAVAQVSGSLKMMISRMHKTKLSSHLPG